MDGDCGEDTGPVSSPAEVVQRSGRMAEVTSGVEIFLPPRRGGVHKHQPERSLARILVSDDSPDIQRIYTLLLPQHGFEVIEAPGGLGQPTVALCRELLPDLVITDVNKPDMSGYDVCHAIRSDPRTAHIPLLFVSAMDELLDRKRGRAVGADDYIVKPFLFEGLIYRLVTLLVLARDARERLVTLTLGIRDFEHCHPVTGIPGPQSLARALPRLTRGTAWAALTFQIIGFEPLLRVYDRTVADDLLLKLAILLRRCLSRAGNREVFMAHPCYGWHITVIGTPATLDGLYREVRGHFATTVWRQLRPVDRERGYLVYTTPRGQEQRAPLPTLIARRIDWRSGPLNDLRALWDALDQAPLMVS